MNILNQSLAIERLQSLTQLHIDSFNFSINYGFSFLKFHLNSLFDIIKFEKNVPKLNIFGFYVSNPNFFLNRKKFKKIPRQCREFKINYNADFLIGLSFFFGKGHNIGFVLKIGEVPIMVRSKKCNLYQQKKKQFIEIDEEEIEIGGYFIINGLEKMIRLLIVPKKNTPMVISRLSNIQRGIFCTSLSCSFRSVDRTCTSRTLHLHYLTTGSIHVRIIVGRREFFFPIIILVKALQEISDQKIFEILINNNSRDKFLRYRIMSMIKDGHEKCNLKNRIKILEFLGKILKIAIPINSFNDVERANFFLSRYIFVHLGDNPKLKVNLFFFMINKLISVQKGICLEDNPDSLNSQEFLLPGHLIQLYFKEKFENSFNYIYSSNQINFENFLNYSKVHKIKKKSYFRTIFSKIFGKITKGISQTISTGSFNLNIDQELSQTTGLSIFLERINFGRFLSYFRSIHRGKFFFEMKNTSGRKLLTQSWGFFCPVHTPDGSLSGILNHISFSVILSLFNPIESDNLIKYLKRYLNNYFCLDQKKTWDAIILDGKILGFIRRFLIRNFVDRLRVEKVSSIGKLPFGCEILFVSRCHSKSFFSSCLLFSEDARLLRPVIWHTHLNKIFISSKKNFFDFKTINSEIELIGPLEQNFLNIENLNYQIESFQKNLIKKHSEIDTSIIFSVIAGATPFSDMNQSPRNIYQCQMSKQSIGTPFYTFWRRNDTKSYFLITPQISICRNKIVQDGLEFDIFPNSFNTIVSVISYTGFDMEDAMVINKSSIQRGFSMINVFNCFEFEIQSNFFEKKNKKKFCSENFYEKSFLKAGNLLYQGAPIIPYKPIKGIQKTTETFFCYKGLEKSIIDQIKISSKNFKKIKTNRNIFKTRARRRPSVGDKFASRHGQKGVFSYDFESENMPFSDSGMHPEIIFNPHGFPSRMTIGVILESIVGKIGALNGTFQDSTPFRFGQNRPAIYHFGEKLRKFGFQFFGNEIWHSGYSGEPFMMDIFTGIINYQRLRHMVLDKYQVSDQGPRNSLTRQPIKGRKLGGSIRFGEMERDALLGQGCAFLLHDRLQGSSDLHGFEIGVKTGNLLNLKSKIHKKYSKNKFKETLEHHKKILLPYVMKFLISELSSLNIKTTVFCI